jgi:hypothetical protein
MQNNEVDIAAVQKVRWVGNGVLESNECTFYYSCHTFGSGFLAGKRIGHTILDFKPISMCMCKLRLRGKLYNYSFICVHAPTRDKVEEEIEKFYDELEKAYDECPRSDAKLILGDFNERVSCEDENENISKYGLHTECNDNDRRLVGFANPRAMTVGATLFPQKYIHNAMWKSPNGTHRNQIDHVLMDGRHRSNLLDVRVFRGPNVDSDHYLVIGKMRGRICNANKEKHQRSKIKKSC